MSNIMLCLNKLGIGGIETAVLNQTNQLIKMGYNVIILAKNGIYKQKCEKMGAKVVDFSYEIKNRYDIEKINKVIEVIEENNIEQVHIHQFDCINTVFPACMIKKIPYVAYLHNGMPGVLDWFEKCYSCYNAMFKLYFNNAEKIVAIKETTMEENKEKYGINSSKYKIIKNSIDFDEFKIENNYIPKKIKNFLIISRIVEEKEKSILNAISLFKKYYEQDKEARLTIVGDGDLMPKIKQEIEQIKDVTQILGQRSDIAQIIAQNDIVLALGRCILETIAMKKIAIISGYSKLKEMILPTNIDTATEHNFRGDGLQDKSIEELVKIIKSLDSSKIEKIVNSNYKYIYDNLNIKENIYLIKNPKNITTQMDSKITMEVVMQLQNMYVDHVEYTDKLYIDCKDAQKFFEGQVNNRDMEIKKLKNELDDLRQEIENERLSYNLLKNDVNKD